MAETPRFAHLMVLLLLGSGLGIASGLFCILFGTVRRAKLATKFGVVTALLWCAGYTLLLLGTGVFSSDKILPEGSWKYFCEPDCHIAYSVASVQEGVALGTEENPYQAHGHYVVVRLKSWFDEKSISKFRGDGPLTPVPRIVSLADGGGRRFFPVRLKSGVLSDSSTPLERPLRPGESYLTSFAFDLPRDARDLRLLIKDNDPLSLVTIDHENSPFHGKIYLGLGRSSEAAAQATR